MQSTAEKPNNDDFDIDLLDIYLRKQMPNLKGSLRAEKINGGQSNPTYFIDYENANLVLRKRPSGEILPSAHAVDREFRVQNAVAKAGVLVPRMHFYESDETIVGTAFYLMDRVDGRIYHDNTLAAIPREHRSIIYKDMASMLAKIHSVNIDAVGLTNFGRQGGFFERQIARWTKQWQLSADSASAAIDSLIDWLPRHCPKSDLTTLVHGDFRTGNLILHPDKPQIRAVLDWELSTLGHPLGDLAHSCVYIWMMDSTEFGVGLRDLDLEKLGLPTMEEFIENYTRASGTKERLNRFHLAFALFRNAVIFEGIADRARRGNANDANAELIGQIAPKLAQRGAELITEGSLEL